MAEDTLFVGLIIVLCVDALLFLGQIAVHDINPDNNFTFTTGSDMPHTTVQQGDGYTLNTSLDAQLPGLTQGVDADTGLSFVDAIITAKNWVVNAGKIFVGFIGGPYFFVKAVLPDYPAISFAVGFIWLLSSVFLVTKFVLGR